MPLLFGDASALAKRFARERASGTVDALLEQTLTPDQATSACGYAETYSGLLRKHNDGRIDFPSFLAAVAALQAEVVDRGRFHFPPLDEAIVFASPLTMQRHNLNATDAAILTMLLDVVSNLPPGDALVLVAADTRLLRGGAAEGLATLNPETVAAADVSALLAAL